MAGANAREDWFGSATGLARRETVLGQAGAPRDRRRPWPTYLAEKRARAEASS